MRSADVPLFSVEQHLPAAAFDVLAFNLSAELVYTNVLNLLDLAGLPLHAADRGGDDALVVAGGHCVYNPEPLADFVDVVRARRRRGGGERDQRRDGGVARGVATRCTRPGRAAARTVRARGRVHTGPLQRVLRGRPARVHAPHRSWSARRGEQAHGERPGRLALSRPAPRAADRGGPRSPQRRGVPRLHAWVPLLPGGHDHTAGPRAAGCPGARDGAARARVERARRGGTDVAVVSGFLRYRGHRARHRRRSRARRAGFGQPAVVAGGRLHRRHGGGDPEGAPHRPHVRPRGWHVADAHGDQQADHRGGSLQRRRCGLQPGVAAGQALLPHRAADRAR